MKIKVTRDANNQWILSRDLSWNGKFVYHVKVLLPMLTYTTSSFFGFLIKQSTASFFQKHFFDDIEIKNYVPDVTPPGNLSATAISQTALDVLFDEPVDITSSQLAITIILQIIIWELRLLQCYDATNASLVHLTFGTAFTNAILYTLSCKWSNGSFRKCNK